MSAEQVNGFLMWAALGVMLGGRLGWWLIYHRAKLEPDAWYEFIAIWHGGMSFHGGLIGVSVATSVFAWRNNIPFWNLADGAALIAPVGLFFGRIANFINAELIGRPSDVPWAMVFPTDPGAVPRHPSQLYEALLEGLLLLVILWALKKVRPREGTIAACFLVLYGIFRFAIEYTREPDAELGFIAFRWLTMGQALSSAMVLTGVGLFLWVRRIGRQGISGGALDGGNDGHQGHGRNT